VKRFFLYARIPFVLVFIMIPSFIYMAGAWIFFPVGLGVRFFSRSFAIRYYPSLLFHILLPLFLIYELPYMLYVFVSKPAGWLFFAWMLIYFITRRFSGADALTAKSIDRAKRTGA
jgi:hypothetical protein